MRILITARHCEIDDGLRVRARAVVARLSKLAARPHRAQVVFAEDHGEAAVEIRLQVPRGRVHVGKAHGVDQRTALDRAAGRVRRQLDRRKTAPRPRRRTRAPGGGAR